MSDPDGPNAAKRDSSLTFCPRVYPRGRFFTEALGQRDLKGVEEAPEGAGGELRVVHGGIDGAPAVARTGVDLHFVRTALRFGAALSTVLSSGARASSFSAIAIRKRASLCAIRWWGLPSPSATMRDPWKVAPALMRSARACPFTQYHGTAHAVARGTRRLCAIHLGLGIKEIHEGPRIRHGCFRA